MTSKITISKGIQYILTEIIATIYPSEIVDKNPDPAARTKYFPYK
ncbi:hypothetical protein [Microcoleus sp. B4-D4]